MSTLNNTLNRKEADLQRFGFKTKSKAQLMNIYYTAYYTENIKVINS